MWVVGAGNRFRAGRCKFAGCEVLRKIFRTGATTLQRRNDRQLTELGSNADGMTRRMRFVMSDGGFQMWVFMWE